MVWGSLAALNHWVLGFHSWPDATSTPRAQRLILPDAPSSRSVVTSGTRALVLPAGLVAGGPSVTPSGTQRVSLVETTQRQRADRTKPAVGSPGGVSAPGNGGTTPGGAADADGDGISNSLERRLGSNPDSADTDNDGVPDGWEIKNGLNPRDFRDGAADDDGDGVPNKIEFRLKTDPQKLATRDGVPDGARDSNGDGVTDAVTVQNGGDPTAEPTPATEPETPAVVTPEPTPVEPVTPVTPEPAPTDPVTPEPTPPTPPVEEPAPTPATPPDPAPDPSPPSESTPPADPPTDPVPAGDTGTGGGVAAPDETAVADATPA